MEQLQFGDLGAASLPFADDVLLSYCDLRHAPERFAAEIDLFGIRFSTSKFCGHGSLLEKDGLSPSSGEEKTNGGGVQVSQGLIQE